MTSQVDETHDPARRSWIESANGETDFPIQNLPWGIFRPSGGAPRAGVAIGDRIIDVRAAFEYGWFTGQAAKVAERAGETLNAIMALGAEPRRAFRQQLSAMLDRAGGDAERARRDAAAILFAADECVLEMPAHIGNFTDFYAGIHHALAAGSLTRPDNPLPRNYKYVPIAYHARASSVCLSGEPVYRPMGQQVEIGGSAVHFGPTQWLDFELELGFFIGGSNARGTPIPIAQAADYLFGAVLLNDWSARDIQFWEADPLGPFLSKNFATTISPWIMTMEALAPFRIAAFERSANDPAPLPYLYDDEDQQAGGIDIDLAVDIRTAAMRATGLTPHRVTRSSSRHLYWTPAQMVAHHTVGGCNLEAGDLIGTGTISGPASDQLASFVELTRAGTQPIDLPDGEVRGFLEDGDEIAISGLCRRDGFAPIGFGPCLTEVEPPR